MRDIDNNQDIIDSRDIIERLDELESDREDSNEDGTLKDWYVETARNTKRSRLWWRMPVDHRIGDAAKP